MVAGVPGTQVLPARASVRGSVFPSLDIKEVKVPCQEENVVKEQAKGRAVARASDAGERAGREQREQA